MDTWEIAIFGALVSACCVLLFISLAAQEVRAQRIAIQRIKEFVPSRPEVSWWCLGPCESEWHGARPADGLCPMCRQLIEGAEVLHGGI